MRQAYGRRRDGHKIGAFVGAAERPRNGITGDALAAAHALSLRNGFSWCGPLGDDEAGAFNVSLSKALADRAAVGGNEGRPAPSRNAT